MAGVAPDTDLADDKPNPVKPGDRWVTSDDAGRRVERTRTAAGDGWDEVALDADMPQSLARAHELLLALHVENRDLRRQLAAAAPATATAEAPTLAVRAATTPTTIVRRPCGGCGKKKP